MTTTQKRKLLKKIVELESDIDTLKRCRLEVASSGYASATLASSGGSKSYTRQSISELTNAISQLTSELKGYRALLNSSSPAMPNQIYTVYM